MALARSPFSASKPKPTAKPSSTPKPKPIPSPSPSPGHLCPEAGAARARATSSATSLRLQSSVFTACPTQCAARDRARTLPIPLALPSTRAPPPWPARRPRLQAHPRFLTGPTGGRCSRESSWRVGGAWDAQRPRAFGPGCPPNPPSGVAVASPRCTSAGWHQPLLKRREVAPNVRPQWEGWCERAQRRPCGPLAGGVWGGG